jgi:U3 small nucleolar RNA-associated protein 15
METGGFAPVVVRRGLAGPARVGAEARRWTLQRAASVALPNAAAVTDLTFSPLAPHDVAAASGPTVAIIDPHTGAVRRTLARFRDAARSPDFKPDGRLLVAGCDNGTVQLFDLSSRSVLRVFNGHEGCVFAPDSSTAAPPHGWDNDDLKTIVHS